MTHTPGPWRVTKEGHIIQTAHITRDVWHIPKCPEDLHLMAAAPDLLEALRELLRVSRMEFKSDGFAAWKKEIIAADDMAVAAIAKAKGLKPGTDENE